MDDGGGREAAEFGETDANPVTNHLPHRGSYSGSVFGAVRKAPGCRVCEGQEFRACGRSLEAAARENRPESKVEACEAGPGGYGRGREGDVVGGEGTSGKHAGEEGKAEGQGEAIGRGPEAGVAAEAAGAKGCSCSQKKTWTTNRSGKRSFCMFLVVYFFGNVVKQSCFCMASWL